MSTLSKGDVAKMPTTHGHRAGLVEIINIVGNDAVVRYLDATDRATTRIYLSLLVQDGETRRMNKEKRLAVASKIGSKTR